MDYKNRVSWANAFPGLPFPDNDGEDRIYFAFGYEMSASTLGNLNYGVVGKAYGFSELELSWQAGAAHMRHHYPYYDLPTSLYKALKKGSKNFYGDSEACNEYILIGFALYDQYKRGRR